MIILEPERTGGETLAITNGQVRRVVLGEPLTTVWELEQALGPYHNAGVTDREHASLVMLAMPVIRWRTGFDIEEVANERNNRSHS